MRQGRLKAPQSFPYAFYHCHSRVVDRQLIFEGEEKAQFLRIVKACARFCQVKVNTKIPMGNHFHLVVKVPRRPKELPTDEALVSLVEGLSGSKAAANLRQRLQHLRAQEAHEAAEAERERYFSRMWDLSAFMKEVKQRFTQWYNRAHHRKGTLWEGRFKSVLSDGAGTALINQCVYVDLNSYRANLVDHPKDYPWCGFAEALHGDEEALEGIRIVMEAAGLLKGEQLKDRQGVLEAYERYMLQQGMKVLGYDQEGKPHRRAMSREEVLRALQARQKLPTGDFLRVRVRYFTDGAVIGSREFVNAIFEAYRSRFGKRRKDGARLIKGLKGEKLYALRDLRVNVFG